MKKEKTRRGSNTRKEDSCFVASETELTGLHESRDSLVSVRAVRMEGGRISVGGIAAIGRVKACQRYRCSGFIPVLGRAGIRCAEGIVKNSSNFKGGERQHVSGGIGIF
ncbi:MAG: hypothetical protein ABSA46_06735 [Thermodesulfovibrionales bacterium]